MPGWVPAAAITARPFSEALSAAVSAALLATVVIGLLLARLEAREVDRLQAWLSRVAEAEGELLFPEIPPGRGRLADLRPGGGNGSAGAGEARQLLDRLELMEPGLRFYLIGPRGVVLESGTRPGDGAPGSINIRELRSAMEGRAGSAPWMGDDPEGGRSPFLASVFSTGGSAGAYLYAVPGSVGPRTETAARLGLGNPLRADAALGRWVAASGFGAIVGLGVLLVVWPVSRLAHRRLRSLVGRATVLRSRLIDVTSDPHRGPRHGGARGPDDSIAVPMEIQGAPRSPGDAIEELEQELAALDLGLAGTLEHLETRARAQRELLANAAHDLRTPLASLRGYLETLSLPTRSLDEREKREYLDIALRQSERLSRLVQDLFDLSRLEGQPRPAFERFHLGELVQDNVQRLRLRAEGVGIELRASFGADLPPVLADVGLMERALQNLLDNALRHTPAGGIVEVRLEEKAGRLEVAVRDTGAGIAAEDQPRIFERFYRSRGKQASKTGAGFGLAITARIAELHGGRLEVESTVGRGSTFRFDLEIAAPTRSRITAAVSS